MSIFNDQELFELIKTQEPIVKKEAIIECKRLFNIPNAQKLFINFFHKEIKNDFNIIPAIIACKKQSILSMFDGHSYLNTNINGDKIFGYNFPIKKYPIFAEILNDLGYINYDSSSRKNKFFTFFLITFCLQKIAENFFSNEFNNNYGNMFYNIKNISIDDAIKQYISIEIITNHMHPIEFSNFYYFLNKYNINFKEIKTDTQNKFNMLIKNLNKNIELKEKNDQKNLYLQELVNPTKKDKLKENNKILKIEDTDSLPGLEFEHYISNLLKTLGYTTQITRSSGDQGIDIIAYKNQLKIGIQTKRSNYQITNSAIQEVVAGINHYNLDKALVITNNYFTESAIELAKSNKVTLWNRDQLIKVINSSNLINHI